MKTAASENRRKKLIRLIHVGKAKLGMNEEAYRAFLAGLCGRDSASKMTVRQLEAAVKAMRKNGFDPLPGNVRPEEKGGASGRQLAYIKGMWAQCARNKSGAALAAFVKRIAGVDALRFLDVESARKVILALRDMVKKAGADPATQGAKNERRR